MATSDKFVNLTGSLFDGLDVLLKESVHVEPFEILMSLLLSSIAIGLVKVTINAAPGEIRCDTWRKVLILWFDRDLTILSFFRLTTWYFTRRTPYGVIVFYTMFICLPNTCDVFLVHFFLDQESLLKTLHCNRVSCNVECLYNAWSTYDFIYIHHLSSSDSVQQVVICQDANNSRNVCVAITEVIKFRAAIQFFLATAGFGWHIRINGTKPGNKII